MSSMVDWSTSPSLSFTMPRKFEATYDVCVIEILVGFFSFLLANSFWRKRPLLPMNNCAYAPLQSAEIYIWKVEKEKKETNYKMKTICFALLLVGGHLICLQIKSVRSCLPLCVPPSLYSYWGPLPFQLKCHISWLARCLCAHRMQLKSNARLHFEIKANRKTISRTLWNVQRELCGPCGPPGHARLH